jgi:hypothetical protein
LVRYAAQTLGLGFIDAWMNQVARYGPVTAADELLQFSKVLTAKGTSLQKVVNGFLKECIRITCNDSSSVNRELAAFNRQVGLKLTLTGNEIGPKAFVNVFMGPFSMRMVELPVAAYTGKDEEFECVNLSDAWACVGYSFYDTLWKPGETAVCSYRNNAKIPIPLGAKKLRLFLMAGPDITEILPVSIYLRQYNASPCYTLPYMIRSTGNYNAQHGPTTTIDRDLGTGWVPSVTDTKWIEFDFQNSINVDRIALYWSVDLRQGSFGATPYEVSVSEDGGTYGKVYSDEGYGGVDVIPIGRNAKCVRVQFVSTLVSLSNELLEFEAYKSCAQAVSGRPEPENSTTPRIATRGDTRYRIYDIRGRYLGETGTGCNGIRAGLPNAAYVLNSIGGPLDEKRLRVRMKRSW